MSEISKQIRRSNIVYFNGRTVKDRNFPTEFSAFNLVNNIDEKVKVDFWDENNKILSLKSKY